MNKTFKCEMCKNTFDKLLTDEEAKEQFKQEFSEFKFEETELALICDDCFKKMYGEVK